MLQPYSPSQATLEEDQSQAHDLGHYIGIFKKRILYFIVPFVILLTVGFLIVAIQRPIYRAEGRVLVESPEIPTDLVEPTVTASAIERIQVIQQRLMARDSLLPIVTKFNLFPSERQWMTGTQFLELMRKRSTITIVDLNSELGDTAAKLGSGSLKRNNAVAFSVGFEYESPAVATKVANEFLTAILSEDVRARTAHATGTTEFLSQEVKRLQSRLDAIDVRVFEAKKQIFEAKMQGIDPTSPQEESPELKLQTAQLADLKAQLVAQSSVHSVEFPAVKSLKKRIAGLEEELAKTKARPKKESASANTAALPDIDALEQQQKLTEKDLDDASKKLAAARLGETMERNQQSEHLEVIEQPVEPQKPVRPNRIKLLAAVFGLATIFSIGAVFLAEKLDTTIRGSRELVGVFDSRLLVTIPYITTNGEIARRKRRIVLLLTSTAVFLLVGLAAALYIGVTIDLSWFDQSSLKFLLTRLSK
jgi:uncharacterized protein involved in exopolysaccharide biosynthesis